MAELSKNNFDLLLRLAADRVMASDVEQFDSIDTTGITISEKTENKILRMIRRSRTADTRKIWIRSLQRVAIIMLVAITATFTAAMCIEPIRAAFVDAIVNWFDDYVSVLFVNDGSDLPTTIEKVYEISNLPEGWTSEITYRDDFSVHYIIQGNNEEMIYIQQSIINKKDDFLVDNNYLDVSEIALFENITAFLYEYDENTIILMWQDEYVFVFSSLSVNKDIIINIAHNFK